MVSTAGFGVGGSRGEGDSRRCKPNRQQLSLIQAARGKKGANRRARNTDDAAIVERLEAGEAQKTVALEYGITQQAVSKVYNRTKAG